MASLSPTQKQDKALALHRAGGKTWEEIADVVGYANGGASRNAALAAMKRKGEKTLDKPVAKSRRKAA